jgi:hypothetical protein
MEFANARIVEQTRSDSRTCCSCTAGRLDGAGVGRATGANARRALHCALTTIDGRRSTCLHLRLRVSGNRR